MHKHSGLILAFALIASPALAQDFDPLADDESVAPPADGEEDPLLEGGTTAAPIEASASATGEESVALDPASALGIGVGFTLPGTPAAMVHKYFGPQLGIQAGLTFDVATISVGPDGMQTDTSIFNVGAVGYAAYRLKATGDFSFNGLAGFEFGYNSFSVEDDMGSFDESGIDFRLSAGIQAEYFVFDKLSLYAQAGLTFSILGDVGTARSNGTAPAAGSDVSSLSLDLGPPSMLQTIGMVWWL